MYGMSLAPWRRWLNEKEITVEPHHNKVPVDIPIAWDIQRENLLTLLPIDLRS